VSSTRPGLPLSKRNSHANADQSFPDDHYKYERIDLRTTNGHIPGDPHNWWANYLTSIRRYEKISKPSAWREELFYALFLSHHRHPVMPFPELEYSYGLKLCDLVKNYPLSVAPLVIETSMFFSEMIKLEQHQHEPAKGGFTLRALYQRCADMALFETESATVSDRTIIHSLWSLLCTFNFASSLPHAFSLASDCVDIPILELFQKAYEVELENGPVSSVLNTMNDDFPPNELHIESLRTVGGLRIKWTRYFNDHLKLSLLDKTLWLFWDASIIGNPLHWPITEMGSVYRYVHHNRTVFCSQIKVCVISKGIAGFSFELPLN
jgi:hypothetical protein